MTKTVPFEILCKSILFIDFCTVLHIEEKKIDCNIFPLLHKCKFYHCLHNLKVMIQLINYSPLRVNLIWIIPKFLLTCSESDCNYFWILPSGEFRTCKIVI